MIEQFIDRYGLVKTRPEQSDTGNGCLYSEIYQLLVAHDRQIEAAQLALWDTKTGLLYRTPDNTYGQESHDNYTAFACLLLRTGNKRLARQVLWSMVKRLGYMKNTPLNLREAKTWKERFKRLAAPWMGRFPRIWIVLLAAALPKSGAGLCSLAMTLITRFSGSAKSSNASGLQLKLLDRMILSLMRGNPSALSSFLAELRTQGISISERLATYYDPSHPTVEGYRSLERGTLNG